MSGYSADVERTLGRMTRVLLCAFMLAVASGIPVRAQTDSGTLSAISDGGPSIFDEAQKFVDNAGTLEQLGSSLFGDRVSPSTGALEFVQTDVDLRGNNDLPVRLGRRLVIDGQENEPYDVAGFAGWDYDIPHLHGVFATPGWRTRSAGAGLDRCSGFSAPPDAQADQDPTVVFAAGEFWHGSFLYVPGLGDDEILERNPNNPPPMQISTFPLATRSGAMIRCITINEEGEEGFEVLTPDGVSYRFDYVVFRNLRSISKPYAQPDPIVPGSSGPGPELAPETYNLSRKEVWILPTRVTDRFGNYVEYQWSNSSDTAQRWKLNSITSSDGRAISVTYAGNAIESVAAGERIWTYGVSDGQWVVVQPDGGQWKYELTSLKTPLSLTGGEGVHCDAADVIEGNDRTGYVTHPSGAKGAFKLRTTTHGRTWVWRQCAGFSTHLGGYAIHPREYAVRSLVQKTITGPGLPSAGYTWSYEYSDPEFCWDPQSNMTPALLPGPQICSARGTVGQKTVTVTAPDSVKTRYTYGTDTRANDGQLLRVEDDWNPATSSAARTTTMQYATYNPLPGDSAHPYPYPLGLSPNIRQRANKLSVGYSPMQVRTIAQDGATFSWSATAFDTRARAINVTRASSLASPNTRTESTVYYDHLGKWILGQIDTVTSGSKIMVDNAYEASTANLDTVKAFGVLRQDFDWNTDGTLSSVTDGAGNTTAFDNYKRGYPQSVQYADGSRLTASVDNNGNVAWLRVPIQPVPGGAPQHAQTDYQYDGMGRLTRITYPAGDSSPWNATTITYLSVAGTEFGLGAGHWRRDESTGTGRKTTYFDALWRPRLIEEYDATSTTTRADTQRFVWRDFNHDGQEVFGSYPVDAPGDWTLGARKTYDGIGRLASIEADSELDEPNPLVTLIRWRAPFTKRVTDARGFVTTTTFQAFDQPSEDAPLGISQPEGVQTTIARDVFGKPTSIVRSGGTTPAVTRSYVYDAYPNGERLCKTIEPESGAAIQHYDAAGNVDWRVQGSSLTTTASCSYSAVPASEKSWFGFDARNRLTSITHPSGTDSITNTYYADGLLRTTSNGPAGDRSTWAYEYNKRRLLEVETLSIDLESDAAQTFRLDRLYNANGALSQLVYPDETAVAYSPNALGQPTAAGSYASNVSYLPNGAVQQFTYGNGLVHTVTPNERLLPETIQDGGVVNLTYGYDANANVVSIADAAQAGMESRSMTYDGLNRLKTANAPWLWGTGNFAYDAQDNLRTAQVGTRNCIYIYTPQNRLDKLTDCISPASSLAYDTRGNVTQRGTQAFTFDRANRMTAAVGVEEYSYDGHGRRVRIEKAGGAKTYQVYSQGGELLFGYDATSGKATNYVQLNRSLVARSDTAPGGSAPGVPTNLRASPNPSMNGMYAVAWNAVQSAASYVLEETNPTGGVSTVYSGSQLSWATAGRGPGTYLYRAKACSAGCSAWSASITVTVMGGAPSISVAPNPSTNGSYTVSWTAVSGATSYALEELPPGGNWYSVSTAPALSWSISGRPNGNYSYRVHGCAASGCGAYSQIVTVVVQTTSTPPPTMNAPTPNPSTTGAYTVSWTTVLGASTYRLEERAGSVGSWLLIQSSSSTSRAVTGQSNGTYSYRVQACNSACSAYSNIVTETVSIVNPPAAPGNITSDDNPSQDGSFTLTWPSVATATSYVLERRSVGGAWQHVVTQANRSWSGVNEPNGSHGFRVKACNSACGLYSNSYTQIVRNAPPMPTITATPNPSTGPIHVSWTLSQGATYYELQERLNGASWPATGGGTTLSQTSVDLLRGNGSYEFRVRACFISDRAYCSDYSNSAGVVVQQSTIPPAPASISGPPIGCLASPRTYTISWTASEGATYYDLHEENDAPPGNPGHVDQIVVVSVPTNSKTFMHSAAPGMGGSSIYSYEVRACSANGCSPYRGTAEVCVGIPMLLNGSSTTTTYVHTDALGSPVATTDAAGTVTLRMRYEPYGAPTNGLHPQGPGFAGHVRDSATGLSYMQQRYYDPASGRFLSVDPVTAYSNGDLRHFNRYAYAYDSPYKFTDPDGRCGACDRFGDSYRDMSPTEREGLAGATALVGLAVGSEALTTKGLGLLGKLKGIQIVLRAKEGWSAGQKAQGAEKAGQLNKLAKQGKLSVTKEPERSATSASRRYKQAGGEVPKGSDVDHTQDLQLGGSDIVGNMKPLDSSVNRSFGAQVRQQTRDVPSGTKVCGVDFVCK